MSWADIADAARTRYNTQIAVGESLTTQYPNAPAIDKGDGLWASWECQEGDSFTATLGGSAKQYRDFGIMVVKLFAPLGTGTGAINSMADTIASKFRNVTDSEVRFRVPRVLRLGHRKGEKWYQVDVLCPYHRTGA